MYQDTFEEDDLIAEVELVAQARYSQNNDVDDGFDTEGKKSRFKLKNLSQKLTVSHFI
jgi:hypothetical protein